MANKLADFEQDNRFTVCKPIESVKLCQDGVPVLVPPTGTVVCTKMFGNVTVLGYVATIPNATSSSNWSAVVTTTANPNGSTIALKAVRVR